MAAAIVPIVEAIAPSLISLIAGLVHKSAPAAEQQFGSGTGPVKFAAVFGDVITALQSAAKAGQIDKQLPSDQTIQVIIQAVVSSMNLQGQISGAPASASMPQQTIQLSSGQSITIAVK